MPNSLSPIRVTTVLATTALAVGLSAAAQAADSDYQPQGLYSAEDILDASVYLSSDPGQEVGEVEDVLLDEGMGVAALVIDSDSVLGLGGRDFVVPAGQFSLITHHAQDGDTEHRVMLDASPEKLESYPVYDTDWWNQARERSREAWEATQEGAQSAWEATQEGAERAWETTREGARRAWETARDALSGESGHGG